MSVSKIIKKQLNQKLTLIVVKCHVFTTPKVDISDNFIYLENKTQSIKLHQKNINNITKDKDNGMHRVRYSCPELITGYLRELDDKFLRIEILNIHTNKTYSSILPLKSIEGIKVHNEEMDESGEEDGK